MLCANFDGSTPKTLLVEILILFCVPPLIVLFRFILFLPKGEDVFPLWLRALTDILVVVALPVFLLLNSSSPQNCCNTDGMDPFAADHLPTIIVWWLLGSSAYFYLSWRKRIGSPLVEVITAWLLLFSVGLNVAIIFQLEDFTWLFAVPIIMLLLMALVRQHRQLTPRLQTLTDPGTLDFGALDREVAEAAHLPGGSTWQRFLWPILFAPFVTKYPAILVLGTPVFVLVDSVLLLFGQRADSLVLAFTQTYHYHFSELGYLCEGVQCGGHYLCSVAAGGHPGVVRPIRYGVRGGERIVCNRQLLVANAFEEVLEERFPAAHRLIRKHYDRVGDFIHKDYTPYENKYLCDGIYLLMKPADWAFRFVLYLVDIDPEGRIARQYTGGKQSK